MVDSAMYSGRGIQKLCGIQLEIMRIPNVVSMGISGNRSIQNSAWYMWSGCDLVAITTKFFGNHGQNTSVRIAVT